VKPEWYFSLILKWHQNYSPILQEIVSVENSGNETQPSSDDSTFVTEADEGVSKMLLTASTIPLEFCRGLVVLARERFKFDLTLVLDADFGIMDDDKLFPHLIDEAVAFDVELRGINLFSFTVLLWK